MAQQKVTLGYVRGDKGEPGKDANISSATATINPGHLDKPTCSIVMGGEPGAQTMSFTFDGLQGSKGDVGPTGKDANISGATITVNPGHSDNPTASVEVSGEAGEKTFAFTFDGLQGKDGVIGKDGAAAGFGTITVNVVDDGEGEPSCEASWEGDNASKNLTLTFHHLKGAKGENFSPTGSSSDIVLGDGTTKTIEQFITENIETIREKLGLATTSQMGPVPPLPEHEAE